MKNYNTSNLTPIDSVNKARELGKKGGIRSGETKRRRKLIRELLEAALDTTLRDGDGQPIPNPSTGKRMTLREAGMVKLARKFANGDPKAIEQAARILGEWEQHVNINAEVASSSNVVMGFDPLAAVREIYLMEDSSEGGGE